MKKWKYLIVLGLGVCLLAGCRKKDAAVGEIPAAGSGISEPEKEAETGIQQTEQQVDGLLEELTVNEISIRTTEGIVLKFPLDKAVKVNLEEVLPGDKFQVAYVGTIQESDTSGARVTRIEKLESVYDGLTEEDAKALITENLELEKYKINLLQNELLKDKESFYLFSITENENEISPSIAVNKKSGKLFCYNKADGFSSISKFPLYKKPNQQGNDWNGNFVKFNEADNISASLTFEQADTNTVEFTITSSPELSVGELINGIAWIKGDTAIFKDENGFSLSFVIAGNQAEVTETGEESNYKTSFAGTYKRMDNKNNKDS